MGEPRGTVSTVNDTLTREAPSFPMLNTSAVIKPVSPTFSDAGRTEILDELTSRSGPLARDGDGFPLDEDIFTDPESGIALTSPMKSSMKKTGK